MVLNKGQLPPDPARLLLGAGMRARLVSILFVLGFAGLAFKGGVVALQPTSEPDGVSRVFAETPRRADIVDRNGDLLATSVTVYSLFADPRAMMDTALVAARLGEVLPALDVEQVAARLALKDRAFVWIQRGLTPRQRQAVFELGLEGLGFREEVRRAYPRGTLAGHVLGFAGADGKGLAGIEYAQEARLSRGGEPLRLTLDANVQFSLEAELARGVAQYGARAGAGLVLDARQGDILAMASWPPVDPHQATRIPSDHPSRFNHAYGSVFELGSVFKPLTAAAALDTARISLSDRYDVSEPIEVRGRTISDTHPIASPASVGEIISDSSNIGTVRIAWKLGAEDQWASLEALGLTRAVEADLAGVARPLLPQRLDPLHAATVSYGHGIAVSPLALAAAYTAFANDGVRVAPRLVEAPGPAPMRQVVWSAATNATLLGMLRDAVMSGTGQLADIPGYRVAGKTGTAEKPVGGVYHPDANICSFAAVFPADSPEYVVLIVLDEPEAGPDRGRAASWNAAPTAGAVIQRIAPILGVTPELAAAPLLQERTQL